MSVTTPTASPTSTPSRTYHDVDIEVVLNEFATPVDRGLSNEEAKQRLEKHGLNQLEEAPPTSVWAMLWEQFNNFVVMLLIAASVVSAFLGDWPEAVAILLIVVLNAGLGVIQERRAEEALAALRQLAAPDAHVMRDGRRQVIHSREVVPGDIVILEAGNYVPADARLIEAVNLRVEEAALTGESVSVQKDANYQLDEDVPLGDRKNTVFMGTLVSYGRGRGVVVATGMQTQIGLIAKMLSAVHEEPTPLQKRLDQLGRSLGYAALALCGLVFLLGWLRGVAPLEMFLIAVSLAIAAVPEGLPAVVTIALALGMREMIQRNALIRRLSSVETLGSATIIGSDKTGTLTQNEMTVTRIWADQQEIKIEGSGYAPEGHFLADGKPVELTDYPAALTTLWAAALNNDAALEVTGIKDMKSTFRVVGDPTEGALLVAAAKVGALHQALEESYPRIQEIPFDPTRKRMVTIHEVQQPRTEDASPFQDGQKKVHVIIVKGAPDVVLDLCAYYQRMEDQAQKLDDEMRAKILEANDRMTQDALRVLGVAFRVTEDLPEEVTPESVEQKLVFVGLLGMIDPPRREVKTALEKARHAGIKTIMITGDYPKTAYAIAQSIGLLEAGDKVLTGNEISQMSDEELRSEVAHTAVFARVSPEHKVRIVEAFQARGEVVAMTGDGINDAPALKRADIGVAMGVTGTDVAKETADMVLTDDNYASIVDAIEQGRVIYSNIRKFVYYLLSSNLAEIASIFIATLLGHPRPLEAIQLLWLNLVTDGAPALALGTEKGDPDAMDVPPRPPREPIVNRVMKIGIIIQTIFLTSVTLAAFYIGLWAHPENELVAKTMAFVTLSAAELPMAFVVRSERFSILKIGIFSNRIMNLAFVSSVVLLLAVVYIPFLQPVFNTFPLGWEQWRYILPLVFIPAIAAEITKLVVARST